MNELTVAAARAFRYKKLEETGKDIGSSSNLASHDVYPTIFPSHSVKFPRVNREFVWNTGLVPRWTKVHTSVCVCLRALGI